ncbi:MAG: D-alanyl-D-alanine carboxypeptidase family protein [Nostocaceae cyanobacterium]|nr:D-alanyl-D-alanine carboxypeptidase family protein [Nostocaceae cyanobacterium]
MIQNFFKNQLSIKIIALITFVLVITQGITYRAISQDIEHLECLTIATLTREGEFKQSCAKKEELELYHPIFPNNSNLKLTEKDRFLTAVTDKLGIIPQPGTFEYILLKAYGAVFVNQKSEIKLPLKVRFNNEEETKNFQVTFAKGKVNGTRNCYLQKPAADALNKARSQVRIPLKSGYAASDCIRSFATTSRFWRKYANDKTLARVREGKETRILGVVAPPGASQHLWGLAMDLKVSNQVQVKALNENGWFRTVENDVPHWSYIGLTTEKLPEFGFKSKVIRGITYWVTPL